MTETKLQNLCFVRWRPAGDNRDPGAMEFSRFGYVDATDPDTVETFDRGNVIVSDAIEPRRKECPVEDVVPVDSDEYLAFIKSKLAEAMHLSLEAGKGAVLGKIFKVQVDDGEAWYEVTGFSLYAKKPDQILRQEYNFVEVTWRGFSIDRYVDNVLGWSCWISPEPIERLIRETEDKESMSRKKEG